MTQTGVTADAPADLGDDARHGAERSLRDEAEQHLCRLVGRPARLREDQWRAIRALAVERRRALVVQRTGWGKSAVYFVATLLLRARGAGPTVIVSPLLALMRNQVAAAEQAGVRARTVNSANLEQWAEVYDEIAAGTVDVLLVSPERLNNPGFRDRVLPRLAATTGLLVVDEAHCISDWGHDFRPDYRRIGTLLGQLPPGVPVLATTATANDRVTRDVADQLAGGADGSAADGLAAAHGSAADGTADGAGTLVLRGPLDRESLHLAVVRLPTAAGRLAWLARHLPDLPGSGIVYTLTVAAAEEVAAHLRERGLDVAAYTGRTEPAERHRAEDDLLANRVKALVATSALGMGFDKPDLGFVVHLGAPPSPVAYYQQVGRAGRGVERAEVLLLPGTEDRAIWDYFGTLAFPAERLVRATLDVLGAGGGVLSTQALEAQVDLSRSRLDMMLKVLDVDGAVRRVPGGWETTGRPWEYDADRYARVAAAREREQRAMLDYLELDGSGGSGAGCRMAYLRRQLDDDEAAACGRCDVCTGRPWPTDVAAGDLDAAGDRLLRPGVEVGPHRQWPTAMDVLGVPARGRIAATVAAEPGRALGRLTDLGRGARLRELLGPGVPDGPVPPDVLDAVVRVLAGWGWDRRPVGVVTVASRSRPVLVESLGQRVCELGRLPLLGRLERRGGDTGGADGPDGGSSAGQDNSARRLAALWDAFSVPPALAGAVAGAGGPLLLVDDQVRTGWTLTVAARLLREAGAPAVLPLALAVRG